MTQVLSIKNLYISVKDIPIVKGIDLTINSGEIHALMGPNGSGKSTLVNFLMGHPVYSQAKGSVEFNGQDLLKMESYERARAGLFLAFQYPKEIAGVTLRGFLYAAYKAQMAERSRGQKPLTIMQFKKYLEKKAKDLHMDPVFTERFVNQGFSGGEKKKAEVLQMHILNPVLALLDETDSGLDVDALKIVAEGINNLKRPGFSALIVTHYARILEYIKPDKVHVMVKGKIVESGGAETAYKLEKEGYRSYLGKEEGGGLLRLDS